MRALMIAALVPLVLGRAAAQTTKPALSPCALATKVEIQEAVGSPVSEGAINAINKSVCEFKGGDAGSSVSIMLAAKGPADSAAKTVAELQKRKISAAAVQGFGDGAYESSPGYGMQQLGAYKGGSQVIVTVLLMGAPEAKSKAVAQAVMRKALGRVQ